MSVEQIDFDLHAVCLEVRSILQSAAAERGLVMTLAYDAALPRLIKGDPVRVRQVLLNLASNAVKFTDYGTVRIEVSRFDPEHLKISVVDSGVGITADQLDRLFQRFTQADSSTTRRYGGTGLGLAISKTLVELMGGKIGVHSVPGAGSTFWITLPQGAVSAAGTDPIAFSNAASVVSANAGSVATSAATATSNPASAAPLASASAATAALTATATAAPAPRPPDLPLPAERGRVLLVEDNFVNQRVAVYMLSKLGAQVDVAKHGREAIEILKNACYDLVLMDCQMPEMDGFEATRMIRDPSSAVLDHDVPVVAMTANAFAEDRARALAAGMNDFLAKPVDRSVLASTLAKWIKPQDRFTASGDTPTVRCAAPRN